MCVQIPDVRVGEPMLCGGVTVFPLFAERSPFPDDTLDYLLAHEAMAAGTCSVREVSEEGSVGTLLVDNASDRPVLFLEGEELCGAKQNRVLASSVLVAGGSRTRIPVCCVQRGKWTYSSRQFSPGSCCPPTLRFLLKQERRGVAVSGRFGRQDAVWREIRRKHRATGTRSEKENLSDALEAHRGEAEDLRRKLPYPEGASGIAVALGGRVVGIDLFDKPATLAKLWDRLVQGIALDALESCDTGRLADGSGIPVGLYRMRSVRWRRTEPLIGSGEAYRARGDDGILATALVAGGTLLHLSVSMPTDD